jgi:hypothetical protein
VLIAIVAAVGVGVARPASSAASVTFGDSLGVPEELITTHPPCAEPCTLATTISPEHLSWFRAPISGTIVRWRIETAAGPEKQLISFRVIASVLGDQFTEAMTEPFTGAGTSEAVSLPTTAGTFSFPTRLPILVGDLIGLNTEGKPLAAVAKEEEKIRIFEPLLADFGPPALGAREEYALLVNADVAAPPTSTLSSTCSRSGAFGAHVTPDPDPAVAAKALHMRIDGGAEAVLPTSGSPGITSIAVPPGAHALEYWGEDSLGQQESAHHAARVLVDGVPPALAISSDQRRTVYAVGERASITVAASDPLAGLQSDPSAAHVPIATVKSGTVTVSRTAVDRCENRSDASFTYDVAAAPLLTHLRVHPASFAAASSGSTIMGAATSRRGTELSYGTSASTITIFAVQRPVRGILASGRCLAPRKTEAHTRGCTRFVNVGNFSHTDAAGAHRLRFTGRLRGTRLPPGAYRLQTRSSVPGGESATTATLAFRILRP